MKKISLIAAVGMDGSIGKNGNLCWKIPEDLKHFKEITLGGTVLMGRKTWESLPVSPLPGRRNIVITRNKNYVASGAEVIGDLEEDLIKDGEVFVIGGGEVYRQTIGCATNLYLTVIHQECPEADTFFPSFYPSEWICREISETLESSTGIKYHFEYYERAN